MTFPSVRRLRTSRTSRLAVALAVLAGACSGPRVPVHIGAKSVTLDVLLGARKAVAGAPVPPAGFVLGPSGFPRFSFDLDAPTPRPPRPPRVRGLCIDPNTVPAEGPPYAEMPLAGTYTYRAAGSFKEGGANAVEESVPDTATVEVLDTRATIDGLTLNLYWKVAVTLGAVTTTTAYRSTIPLLANEVADGRLRDGVIYPKPPDEKANWPEGEPLGFVGPARGKAPVPPYPAPVTTGDVAQPPRGVHYGLYIESVDTRPIGDAVDTATEGSTAQGAGAFRPAAPGLLLAKYPLEVGSTFDVTGGDGETTMSYRTTIRPKAPVRSCLLAFDTWTIELTRGKVTDTRTGEAVDFTARYQVATGFGGLIAEDHVEVNGHKASAAGVVPIVRQLSTTIETLG